MKKTLIISFLGVFLAFALPGFAQTALTTTSLNAALNSSSTTVSLVSATGVTANNTMLFVLDGNSAGEAMFVNSVSGTSVGVTRGYQGAGYGRAHIKGALVFVGPPIAFNSTEPNGACTAANTLYTPYINIFTAHEWLCSTISLSWVPGFFNTAEPAGVTTLVASVAGATNPSGPLFHISGTAAITAWGSSTTATSGGMGGSATSTIGAPFCVIPDAAFTTTATNNIAIASTAVANKILCFTFDQTNKKYVASY